jgi:hypothetical protein
MSLFMLSGFFGGFCLLLGYFLVNSGKLADDDPRFHLLNLIGALSVIVSLMEDWNLPVFILEIAWSSIALYGLYQSYRNNPQR